MAADTPPTRPPCAADRKFGIAIGASAGGGGGGGGTVSQAATARMAVEIRRRTGELLDSIPLGERFDWVDKVSIELTTGMLAASASSNEAGYITHKVARSWGLLALDNQARV